MQINILSQLNLIACNQFKFVNLTRLYPEIQGQTIIDALDINYVFVLILNGPNSPMYFICILLQMTILQNMNKSFHTNYFTSKRLNFVVS